MISSDGIESFVDAFVSTVHAKDVVLCCNQTLWSLYGADLRQALEDNGIMVCTLSVPDGEESKNLHSYVRLLHALEDFSITRKTPFIALGGGVTGDLVGFLAATYLRGVPFVQIPTTLLAMVDSSVGGKVGVNGAVGKNRVGAFYPPVLVYICTDVLHTLPEEEWLCGLGEVLKHGLLGDPEILKICEQYPSKSSMPEHKLREFLFRNCSFKAKIVEEDELEHGVRALLNFGHTVGHAIETSLSHQVKHGICVVWGLRHELSWALLEGSLHKSTYKRICSIFDSLGFPPIPKDLDRDKLLELVLKDKKIDSDGSIPLTMLHNIGSPELYRVQTHQLHTLFPPPQEISA
jgi:3-dehydroquinate synthase